MESNFCTVDQAERLKELGVKQESLFYWTHSDWGIMPKSSCDFKNGGSPTSMFTASEIVSMYPSLGGIDYSEERGQFYRQVKFGSDSGADWGSRFEYYNNFTEALAAKLINAIEQEYISVVKINNTIK